MNYKRGAKGLDLNCFLKGGYCKERVPVTNRYFSASGGVAVVKLWSRHHFT